MRKVGNVTVSLARISLRGSYLPVCVCLSLCVLFVNVLLSLFVSAVCKVYLACVSVCVCLCMLAAPVKVRWLFPPAFETAEQCLPVTGLNGLYGYLNNCK